MINPITQKSTDRRCCHVAVFDARQIGEVRKCWLDQIFDFPVGHIESRAKHTHCASNPCSSQSSDVSFSETEAQKENLLCLSKICLSSGKSGEGRDARWIVDDAQRTLYLLERNPQ